MQRILVAVVVLLSCRSTEPPVGTPTGSATQPPPPPASPVAADIAVGATTAYACKQVGSATPECAEIPLEVDASALARLLPANPGLPTPLRGLRLGFPYDEQRDVPPEALHNWSPPGFPGVVVQIAGVNIDDGKTTINKRYATGARVFLPRAKAAALVAGVWGPPTENAWINREDGYQAELVDNVETKNDTALVIRRYVTLEALIGDSTDRFAFEPKPLLGLSGAEVMALLPHDMRPVRTDDHITLALPAIERSPHLVDDTVAELKLDASDRVVAVAVHVTAAFRQRITDLARGKGPQFHMDENPGNPDDVVVREFR